jgi:hypothetical protein
VACEHDFRIDFVDKFFLRDGKLFEPTTRQSKPLLLRDWSTWIPGGERASDVFFCWSLFFSLHCIFFTPVLGEEAVQEFNAVAKGLAEDSEVSKLFCSHFSRLCRRCFCACYRDGEWMCPKCVHNS